MENTTIVSEYYDFSLYPDVPHGNLPEPNSEKYIKLINGKKHIIKFPDPPIPSERKRLEKDGANASYSRRNTAIAEYIGSHIFQILGFPAQNTIIGKDYREDGKIKEVIGCESFLLENEINKSFYQLIIEKLEGFNPRDTRLSTTLQEIDLICKDCDPEKVKERFFEMTVVDAFIQNYDRNHRNWGFIESNGILRLAPVYDCGSSLFSSVSDTRKKSMLENSKEYIKEFLFDSSAILDDHGKKFSYLDLLTRKNELNKDGLSYMWRAFKKIVPLINARMPSIYKMIDEIPLDNRIGGKGQLQKDFYKLGLQMRKEFILDRAAKELYLDDKIKLWTQEIKEQDRKKARQERERMSPQKTIIPEIKIQTKGKSRFD